MEIISNFTEILNDLLIEHNLNARTLSIALGVSNPTISRYLKGKRVPTIEYLVKLADYFNCSTDYLLGLEETTKIKNFSPCPPFSERLEYLLKYFKCSSYYVYHNTGISQTRFYKWKNGVDKPTVDNVIKIANLFGCSVDFTIGRSNA